MPSRVVKRRIRTGRWSFWSGGVFACTLLFWSGGLGAQTPGDTAAVILAAWPEAVGEAPVGHPVGETRRICLDPRGRDAFMDFSDLSPTVLETLTTVVRETHGFERTRDCVMDWSQPGFGGWIVDDRERPAALVTLSGLEFLPDRRAEVALHVGAGARFGVGRQCALRRSGSDGPWEVRGCAVTTHR